MGNNLVLGLQIHAMFLDLEHITCEKKLEIQLKVRLLEVSNRYKNLLVILHLVLAHTTHPKGWETRH